MEESRNVWGDSNGKEKCNTLQRGVPHHSHRKFTPRDLKSRSGQTPSSPWLLTQNQDHLAAQTVVDMERLLAVVIFLAVPGVGANHRPRHHFRHVSGVTKILCGGRGAQKWRHTLAPSLFTAVSQSVAVASELPGCPIRLRGRGGTFLSRPECVDLVGTTSFVTTPMSFKLLIVINIYTSCTYLYI